MQYVEMTPGGPVAQGVRVGRVGWGKEKTNRRFYEGLRGWTKGLVEEGGGGFVGATDKPDPPRHRFAAAPSVRGGGSHTAGGSQNSEIWGRRPYPGLPVPDASRQEAEANVM